MAGRHIVTFETWDRCIYDMTLTDDELAILQHRKMRLSHANYDPLDTLYSTTWSQLSS